MNKRRLLYVALGVWAIASLGVADPLALLNEGIQFPDGSVQTTAGQPAGTAVQVEAFLTVLDGDVCSAVTTLYTVPAQMELLIEFMSIESNAITLADPVDVDLEVNPGGGAVQHSITRLDDSIKFPTSLFFSQRFSTERDESRALLERKRCLDKLQKDLDIPNEVLMSLPSAGDIHERAERAKAKLAKRQAESQSVKDRTSRPAPTEDDWGI